MPRALLLIGLSVVIFASCGSRKPQAAGEHYTVRGKIAAMANGPQSKEIEIHHEAIPTFRNQQGKVNGMHSMQMPFAVAADISLAAFSVGDKVTFEFEVVWDDKSPLHLTRLDKLPADAALTLE